jgi:ferredoxin
VFDQDEQDGIVVLRTDNPAPELWDSARLAARVCLSEAITIHED